MFQILWTRICSNIVDKNMFKYCRQEYVQILSTFKYCRQEYVQILLTFKYCRQVYVQILSTRILSTFWDRYENFEYIHKKNLNVGHLKSGFAHSFLVSTEKCLDCMYIYCSIFISSSGLAQR